MSNEHKSCFQNNIVRKKKQRNNDVICGPIGPKDLSTGKQHIYFTSAQADMALYAGLRFPPFVEWFAETKTAGESL